MQHYGARLLAMSRPTLYAISHHAKGKPVIVFVPNRKTARRLTKDLIHYSDPADPSKSFLHCDEEDIKPFLEKIENKGLKEV
jgi:pre-mRNA-splicing helicase BRR2